MRFGMVRHSAKLVGVAAVAIVALGASRASAQPGHDAFDKPLGYDTGREEQAAHNYLNRTGSEDANGDSQLPANQYGNNNGFQRRGLRNQNQNIQQNGGNQNQQADNDDDDAQHHAALGVSLRESDGHVQVIAVLPGSPASRAGLRVGDEIRYVGDQRIATAQGLAEEIGEYKPGSQVDLSIRRDGEKQTLTAQLGSRRAWSRDNNRDVNRDNNRDGRDDNRTASNQNRRDGQSRDAQSRDGQSDGRQTRYSVNPGQGQQRSQGNQQQGNQRANQQLQDLQQRVSQLQQELNNLRASLGDNR